ncbi:DUF5707 domain-containing protein [Streptomyces liangshanensis]|uniref:Calcium-binding protein n=1 Tax=Streptomyces liangshanensis TaxID=2717324 RepID=A0A6G9H1L9_9ACTN|nr:DUF5707 domain-containing protein [Streptomyces liangshanensis]QIQ04216.1 calcium-binding protein [Streptomyces liangshanensis]
MRMRATVAVVTGALALSALAIPASQASPRPHNDRVPFGERGFVSQDRAPVAGKRAPLAASANTQPVISKVVVNGGKPIAVGTTAVKKVTATLTASDDSGIEDAYIELWKGSSPEDADNWFSPDGDAAKCKAAGATTSTCTVTFSVDPEYLYNVDATTWKITAAVLGNDQDVVWNDKYSTVKFQRQSQLTVNAAPEPVKKGKTVTVTGKLARANWDTGKYAGYSTQPVKLQFRKKTATTYTTVKTVKTSTTGTLKTTTKATVDGYYRWSFAGTSTTPAINATGDFVDVK